MSKQTQAKFTGFPILNGFPKMFRGALSLTLVFLLVEFYDEFFFAVGYTARPSLRADLGLTYAQVGLLLGLPSMLNIFIEPVLMLLGDTAWRKRLVLGGGLVMAFSALLVASAHSFPAILLAEIISFPASGAFVTLSQATLMDMNPSREPHMMARWSASGSLANLAGPLVMAGGFALAFGWRWAYVGLMIVGLLLVLVVWHRKFQAHPDIARARPAAGAAVFKDLLRNLWEAIRNPRLMRWVVLLQFSDLLLDMFTSYMTLYFADVVGLNAAQTGVLLSVYMLVGLASDLALIRLLEHFPGRTIVRFTAACALLIYPAFLLAPWPWVKIGLVMLLHLGTLGWWPVMEGETFATIPGRSGTIKAIGSLAGLSSGVFAWLVGWVAGQAGLPAAMWLLLAGPVCLALFVPRPVR